MTADEVLDAVYYDGETAVASRVELLIDRAGAWHVRGAGIERSYPSADVRVMPASGRSPRSVLFADGTQCEVQDPDRFERIASRSPTARRDWVAVLENNLPAALTVLVLAAAFSWAVYAIGIPELSLRVASGLPSDIEERMSGDALASLDDGFFRPSQLSPERRARIAERFKALAIEPPPYRLEFRRMSGDIANAVTLPSGVIVMSDRLVEVAQDDDELVAVLAHELGHVRHRHVLRQMLQSSVVQLVTAFVFNDASRVASIGGGGAALASAKYSRDFEREADDDALEFLRRGGIPPQRFADILRRLESAGPGAAMAFLSTHPATEERVRRFESR